MTATYTVHHICAECQATHDTTFELYTGDPIPIASAPKGWTEVWGKFYCPLHEVEVHIVGRASRVEAVMITPSNIKPNTGGVHTRVFCTKKRSAIISHWETKAGKHQWQAAGNCGEEPTQEQALAAARRWVRGQQL
jgi:hypothetical protein